MRQIKSCAGRLNPRGLQVPAFAGRVGEPALFCVQVRVELAVGRVRVSSKIAKHMDVLKLFASTALRTVGLQQLLHYDVQPICCETLALRLLPCGGQVNIF